MGTLDTYGFSKSEIFTVNYYSLECLNITDVGDGGNYEFDLAEDSDFRFTVQTTMRPDSYFELVFSLSEEGKE